MINEYNPDFIAGTESWLSPNIYSSEIFPPTSLSDRTEMIIIEEFLLHVNLFLSVRKSQYPLPVKL